MTLRLGAVSDDERYTAWRRVIERVYGEHVHQAWNHYLFRLLRAVFVTNPRLSEEGGFVFEWMVENYVDAALMLLRRELDQQAGTENLRNLLFGKDWEKGSGVFNFGPARRHTPSDELTLLDSKGYDSISIRSQGDRLQEIAALGVLDSSV